MTGTQTHVGLVGDAELEEMTEAGWPPATRSAAAEWFDLSPVERGRLRNGVGCRGRLGAASTTSGEPPPWPVDLLYVPSPGGALPFIGPSSVRPWLAPLHPQPGDRLHVFPISTARYERESIASMRCAERFELESVVGPLRWPLGPSVVVEPKALRVITYLRAAAPGVGRPTISAQAVHILVPWHTVARVTMAASQSAGPRDGPARGEAHIHLAYNDGWRICHLDMTAPMGKRCISDDGQLLLMHALLDAVAGAQGHPGLPATDSPGEPGEPCGSEQVVEFDRAVRFGLVGP